jgi:hypothetical protein
VFVEFVTRVNDIRLDSRDAGGAVWQVLLDETKFVPGGPLGSLIAVARSGATLEVAVERVMEDEDGVWHFVRKPLIIGTEVRGTAG